MVWTKKISNFKFELSLLTVSEWHHEKCKSWTQPTGADTLPFWAAWIQFT